MQQENGTRFTLRYDYDANGWLKKRYMDQGYLEYYTYDPDGRVETITTNSGWIEIAYDVNGYPWTVKRVDSSGTVQDEYFYDADGRLRFINCGTPREIEYRYDARGNLTYERDRKAGTTRIRTHDLANQLGAIEENGSPVAKLGYDVRGNLEFVDQPGVQETSYIYDADHRLRTIRRRPVGGGGERVESLVYDPLDRRVADVVEGQVGSELRYAALYPVAWQENGAHHTVVPDTDRLRLLVLLGEDGPRIPAWVLGNGTFVHDPYGTFKGLQACWPYGDHAAGARELNPFAYKGYYRAPLRGIYLPFARGYNSQFKAFMSPDALPGNLFRPISMNRRRLFSANPVRYVDLFGLQDVETDLYVESEEYDEAGNLRSVDFGGGLEIEGGLPEEIDTDWEGLGDEWDWDWELDLGLSLDVPGLDVPDLPDLKLPEFFTGIGRILIDPEAYRQWRGPTRFEEIVAHPEKLTRFGPQEVLGVPAGVAQSTRGAKIPAYVAAVIGVAGVGAGALTLEEMALLGRGATFGGRAAVRATSAGARAAARGVAAGARVAARGTAVAARVVARGSAAGAQAAGRGIVIGARATAQRATTVARITGEAAKRAMTSTKARQLGRAAALDAAKEVLAQHYRDPYGQTEPDPDQVAEAAVQGIMTGILLERLGLGGLPENVQELIVQIIVDKLFTPFVYEVGQTAASEVEY